ncbi:MAG: response regulator transcription factor [Deltaproteobacteria bacterium]|nr:MAG: response regulator transcription factor [Deltaproteobacteria bacterium]
MASHILLVEDEKDIRELLCDQLKAQGHQVTAIGNGAEALEFIQSEPEERENSAPINLFVLDRMLPGTSGLEICKFIRMYKPTKSTPVLMVTAMTEPEQIVEGLDAGADDYVTKPFDMRILVARVRNLLKRGEMITVAKEEETPIMKINELTIDTNQCKVWLSEAELDLTLSEYKLLCAFMKEPGKVFTRNQLVEHIQDGPVHVTDRTIDTHIFGLRKKLGPYAHLIETIRGVGYRVLRDEK